MEIFNEFNVLTNTSVEREFNTEEKAFMKNIKKQDLMEKQKTQEKAIAKAALLEKLGITSDEAVLLLS